MTLKKTTKIYWTMSFLCLVLLFKLSYVEEQKSIPLLDETLLNEKQLIIEPINQRIEKLTEQWININTVTYAYVETDWIDMRSEPNMKSVVKDSIPFGQPVALIKQEYGWIEILSRQGIRGWVKEEMLVDSKSAEMAMLLSSRYHNRSNAVTDLVEFAHEQLGKPYVWGAVGPRSFDCSGFVQYVYKAYGIQMPRVSADQALVGRKVGFYNLIPGDLVFFDTRGDVNDNVSHVGIYIGEGSFIHASSGKNAMRVTISSFDSAYYKGAFLIW